MLRPCLPRAGTLFKSSRRGLRTLPMLRHDFSAGIPGLFSGPGFHMGWTEYQTEMIDRLNFQLADSGFENTDTKTVAIVHARNPNTASIFNHASMAHNNHHFYNTLSPVDVPMSDSFKNELEGSFGSIETLKEQFMVTGTAMFGPGFVWLVRGRGTPEKKYSLLCTYQGGSPYPGAHWRKQTADKNTEPKSVGDVFRKKYEVAEPTNTVGAFGPQSEKTNLAPGGVDVNPILCLNMWEHTYLTDYGVRAKHEYINNWWSAVDWSVVESNAMSG